jgi:8-oxo-dGTP pyrophosphatase MutT (NUDIX family)
MAPKRRRASLLVVDSRDRLLLFQYPLATGEKYWTAPGGGLEQGESFEVAASREAHEELGLERPVLTHLGDQSVEIPLGGVRVPQEIRIFLIRVRSLEFDPTVLDLQRREGVLQTRWWSSIELAATRELVFPANVAAILDEVLSRG